MRWGWGTRRRLGPGSLLPVFAAGLLASGQAQAAVQTAAHAAGPVAPADSLTEELQSLATRAAVVFAGQVVSIERRGGVVNVEFRVEQTVLGTTGANLTLREWAGLWPQGQFRYTVGERALVFLHLASAAGFASPVDGADGVVPVVVQGANAPELLDIRRLAAAILRTPGTPLPTEANGAIPLSNAIAVITSAARAAADAGSARQLALGAPVPLRVRSVEPGLPVEVQTGPLGSPLRMPVGSGAAMPLQVRNADR